MTFLQFAYKNVVRNKRAYLAFFLSSAFSVMVFFTFAMLLFHPALEKGYLNTIAKRGLSVAEWIIFAFSILFVLYSVNAFLKSRSREFGILTIQGIAPGQLRKLITAENIIIGVLSIVTGIIGGLVFAKTFFTIGAYILEMDALPLYLPWKALALTAACFLMLFILLSQFTVLFIKSKTVTKLIKGTGKIKPEPKPSVIFSVIGIGCLGSGYWLVLFADIHFPQAVTILILTIIGTYFFFRQSSIWLLRLLKKRKSFYLRGKNVLWVSDLVYRLNDNARLFFLVCIISAVAFTATGTLVISKTSIGKLDSQYEIEYLLYSGNQKEQTHVKLMEQKLKDGHFSYEKEVTKGIYMSYSQGPWVLLTSEGEFQKHFKSDSGELKDGEAMYYPNAIEAKEKPEIPETLNMLNKDSKPANERLKVKGIKKPLILLNSVVVVNGKTFEKLKKQGEFVTLYGYNYNRWKESLDMIQSLEKDLREKAPNIRFQFDAKASTYFETVQLPSLSLFIGLFIAVLFFTASGSFLYFRLFTDLEEDQQRYRSLAKIGLSEKEMSQSVTIQLAILFFFPFALAAVHTYFAMKTLEAQSLGHFAAPVLMTIGGFLTFQLLFFMIIRKSYLKKLKGFLR
ncbi:FtsX-like permease family protein [Bacillus paralicheniformis]|uniref:ABC transporter permease protein YvcS n=1 Tax=Bacillus paralicheniformis TaxID=1648923 RepID=A0A7Z1B531_9BACI|nr:ABC transporter permease [Bacillus paralicheniformis]MBC8621872.1 ABC transporter permease [Robertmurraya crescens]MBL7475848.1 ABC transporter permease [Bacillus paralicheniformis]MBX9432684.1 ABC transporter permease [Bacillus paralicheniformis]MCW4366498.1 ABC transporter permease [Bacillus paralicheniformis]MDU0412409.1 ABC transporter permease [Bacillus paralicheniformis]